MKGTNVAAVEMLSNGEILEITFKMTKITFKESQKDSWERRASRGFQVIWSEHLKEFFTN